MANRGRGHRGGCRRAYVPNLGDHDRGIGILYPRDEMAKMRRQIVVLTEMVQRLLPPTKGSDGFDEIKGGTHHSFDNIFWAPRRHRTDVGRMEHKWENNIKIELPEFHGSLNPDEFIDWLNTIERIFDYGEVFVEKKVKLVAIWLKGRASAWWEQLQLNRRRCGKEKIHDCEKMKKKLKGHFLPFNYLQSVYQRLHVLKQDGSVNEYTKAFYQLIARPWRSNKAAVLPKWDNTPKEGFEVVLGPSTPSFAKDNPPSKFVDKGASSSQAPRSNGAFGNHNTPQGGTFKCFRCGEPGHRSSDCRKNMGNNRNKTLLIEEVEEHGDFENAPIFDRLGNVAIGGDSDEEKGLALMLKKTFLSPKLESQEDWLHTNIFYSTCNIAGRVCNMIIDSGSCENIVLKKWWTNLIFRWRNIPILILHRLPNGKGYFQGYFKSFPSATTLLASKEFVEETQDFGIVLVLVPVVHTSASKEKVEVATLLEEYSDVFPQELPPDLPLMRDIQHRIDLVPRSALPNKSAYRMSPKEKEELQRQVEKLLAKGYIWPSHSPCGVLVLLTPKKDGSWRMCVDSRAISKITIKYRFPIPRLDDMLDCLVGSKAIYPNFSSIAAPLTNILKLQAFEWSKEAADSFPLLKKLLTEAPILALPDFDKTFELDCDASGLGIGGILSQEGRSIAFFSEKLNGAKLKYSTYDLEFYAIIQAIKHWSYYLAYKEFVLNTDHEALKYIISQSHLNKRHGKWVAYLQQFTFSLRHKLGVLNKVWLSRRTTLLIEMKNDVVGFDEFRTFYASDPYFSKIFDALQMEDRMAYPSYMIRDGFLFHGLKLCS
ncbi:uncharacterized protein LOC114273497 [Camellia sinensis]|uniref:uncharacterized protein LOC114273497 n=1 Tax=Camellia sinensis TaxID=4442 RepID=UPI001035DB59|nr:uncharacterized protein LOC114273497 [Camellia sinensis]